MVGCCQNTEKTISIIYFQVWAFNMSLKELDDAVELNNLQAVRQLLLSLSRDRILTGEPVSLLHMAVSIGHIRCTAYLLDQQPYSSEANVKDSCLAWTPLMYAVANNDVDMLRYLVSTGKFNLDARDIHEQTVLHIAALSRETTRETLVVLIQKGSDIEAEDSALRTPFLRSVEARNLPVAQMLYSMDCNVHKMTAEHHTALHLAMASCDEEMISFLIRIGCDVNAEDIDLQTPLMLLVQEKRQPDALQRIMRSLIAAGASINHRDGNGCSVFLHAISNPLAISKQHLQLLIDSGSNIDMADNTGLSPLWQAVFDGGHYPDRVDVVQLLVGHNCQLDRECCGKLLFTSGEHWIYCYETPLSPFEVALDSSCYGVAQLLLYAGCRVRPEVRYDYCQPSTVPAEINWLKQAMRSVSSLKHLCCIYLRRFLGQDIQFKVQCLPIPSVMKSYVLLENLKISV